LVDLEFLHCKGFVEAIRAFRGPIVGICGGFQMLGNLVRDPEHVEGTLARVAGLELLDVETVMLGVKETHLVEAELLPAAQELVPGCASALTGYEIHMGETSLGAGARPFSVLNSRSGEAVGVTDGAVSADGRVFGTYLHGIFDNHDFRTAYLNRLRRRKGLPEQKTVAAQADPFDQLAEHMERHLDLERILGICGLS